MEYKVTKQLSQFDSFLLKNNQQPTPRRSNLAPYPFKNQPPARKQINMKQNQPLIQNKSRSPARSASRKTLGTHQDSQSSFNHEKHKGKSRMLKTNKHSCQNHDQLQGTYHITIQGEELFYCEKCANKLKSQGFPVKAQLSSANSNRSNINKSNKIQDSYPHLLGHPQFQTLHILLQKIYVAQNGLRRSQQIKFDAWIEDMRSKFLNKMQNLQQLIRDQKAIGLKAFVQLKQEYKKQFYMSEQLCEESLSQIQTMKNDIESNIESIVGEVDQQTFQQCVHNYNQRLNQINKIPSQKTERITELTKNQRQIDFSIFEGIKSDLQRVLSEIRNQQTAEIITSEHSEMIFSGSNSYQMRGAFRNLFDVNPGVQRKRGISKR